MLNTILYRPGEVQMKHKELLAILFFALFSMTIAQPTVQDFTGTDIEGHRHTLFDYLDNDQSVVIHFTGSW
jgi:hypothetical protein